MGMNPVHPVGDTRSADEAVRRIPSLPLCEIFREWPIEAYAALYTDDLADYPALRARLPRMPSLEIQRIWTWFSGAQALSQGIWFSRLVTGAYGRLTGRNLADATVLDYGAGWGRMTRMMLQYIPDERVFACDGDLGSVDLFNSLGFPRPCDAVDKAPTRLPYADGQFDFVWLWSVLTHLPPPVADAVMRAVARILSPSSLLLVTVRPPEFWLRNPIVRAKVDAPAMVEVHARDGIAHLPIRESWGDTSMSIDYISARWPELRIVDVTGAETDQVEVWLTRSG